MTTTLTTNNVNDIFIKPNGLLSLSSGIEAVRLACMQAAGTQLGELIYNKDYGVPTLQSVWSGSPNKAMFAAKMRTVLSSVQDVLDIPQLNVGFDGEVLTYDAIITTTFGEVSING